MKWATEPSFLVAEEERKQVGGKKEYRQDARGRQSVGDRNAKVRISLQRAGP